MFSSIFISLVESFFSLPRMFSTVLSALFRSLSWRASVTSCATNCSFSWLPGAAGGGGGGSPARARALPRRTRGARPGTARGSGGRSSPPRCRRRRISTVPAELPARRLLLLPPSRRLRARSRAGPAGGAGGERAWASGVRAALRGPGGVRRPPEGAARAGQRRGSGSGTVMSHAKAARRAGSCQEPGGNLSAHGLYLIPASFGARLQLPRLPEGARGRARPGLSPP